MEQTHGLIAILDALGAANYTDQEIAEFLKSRSVVLKLLAHKTQAKDVTTFTFNDTVLIVYKTSGPVRLNDVHDFCELLRRVLMYSLTSGILFRGAFAIGTFYVEDRTNTVLGGAVTDAAAWYNASEWIGVSATPHASLAIQALQEGCDGELDAVLVDYAVPLKGRDPLALKAVNWPKGFVVGGLRPDSVEGKTHRAKLLALLTRHRRIPKGTESKYANSVAFFDHCLARWREQKAKRKASDS